MKDLLAYLGLRLGVGLVGLLPARFAQRLGAVFGSLWFRFDGARRYMAGRHMVRAYAPESPPPDAVKSVMRSYGRYWAEAFWVRARRIPEMLDRTTVEGLDMVIEAGEEGKGVIYALPHIGNWEAAAPVSSRVGLPVVAVAENLPNRRITEWFTKMRAECDIDIVLATGSTEVMRRLEAALAANRAVALPSDRDLKGRGVVVEFFGEETTMPAGPATLAIRNGAPLFPVASYFDGVGHRVVVRPPIPVPEKGSRTEKVAAMTQSLAQHFEQFVRDSPVQWHLVVPNWPSDREG